MALLKNKNFAFSTLAGGIAAGDTSLTVASGHGSRFPSSGDFICAIWGNAYPSPGNDPNRELIEMTFTSGDTFAITRGQENTSASAWSAGDNIALVMSAGKMDELEEAVQSNLLSFAAATGTNSYAAVLDPAISSYALGMAFNLRFANASTGACTLAINSLAAKKLYKFNTVTGLYSQAGSGDILAGGYSTVFYDTTLDAGAGGWILVTSKFTIPEEFSSGDALVAYQSTAPTGWTIKSDWPANSMFVVGNSFSSGAGSDDPTSWTTNVAVNNHVLTTAELPSHSHSGNSLSVSSNGNHRHSAAARAGGSAGNAFSSYSSTGATTYTAYTNYAGTHNHSISGNTGNVGSGSGHNHTVTQDTFNPRYAIGVVIIKD